MKTIFALLVVFSLPFFSRAQTPTIQDCLGAIPVCQQIYTEAQSPSGDGNYNNEINTSISCTAGELNSIWYVFTVQQDGFLGFVITPNNPNDDYDWTLFNITNADCSDIRTNPNLQVSCNAAGGSGCHGQTGATGATTYDEQGGGCFSFPPTQFGGFSPFNDRVPMQRGNTYVLMVSNWTGSTNGYTLDFGLSTGLGIIDETRPSVEAIEVPDNCGDNTIVVTFTENIRCSTASDVHFRLNGPGGPYTLRRKGGLCLNNAEYDRTFTFEIEPPINELGDYTFELVTNQMDEVTDLCGNPSQLFSYPFQVDFPLYIDVELGPDTSLLCVGETVQLDATNPFATYTWQDGSNNPVFTVTNSGIYSVTAVNACGTVTDLIEVIYLQEPPRVDFGADLVLCPGEEFLLDAANPFSEYVWQDGSSGPSFNVTSPGAYSVLVTNACGEATDAIAVDYISPIQLELGPDRTLCAGESLVLNVTQEDAIRYRWNDGFDGPVRTITQNGNYAVTVTTECEERNDAIQIFFIQDPVVDLGPDTTICAWQPLVLDATIPGASYRWQDGSTAPVFTVTSSGEYAVSVNTACNELNGFIRVTVIDSIRTELGRDTFYCPYQGLVLDAAAGVPADYLWSDGSDQSTLVVREAGTYSVVVSTVCQEVTDQINVKACEYCGVFTPTAFSPNNDGINDVFQVFPECEVLGFRMQVYDRWGAQLFESGDPSQGWDGKHRGNLSPTGVYVWWLEYTFLENGQARTKKLSGDVALVR